MHNDSSPGAAERWLALALRAAHMVAWSFTLADGRTRFSDGAAEFFGMPLAELDGGWRYVHPEDAPRLRRAADDAVRHGTEYFEVVRYRAPNAPVRWLEVRGSVQRDAAGAPVALHGVTWDITAHHVAEHAARVNEENFARAFAASPEALTITRLEDGCVLEVNQSFLDLYGATREQVVGRSTTDLGLFTGADDRTHAIAAMLEAGGQVRDLPRTVRRIDGERRDVLASVVAIEIGGERCLLTSQRDVTERRRVERELRDSEARYRALVEHLPGGSAFVVDRDGRYVTAGGEALARAGMKREDFVGRRLGEVLDRDVSSTFVGLFRRALAGEPFTVERDANGRTYLGRGVPLRDSHGEVQGALAVFYDITERKQVERRLAESEQRLQLALEGARMGTWRADYRKGEVIWDPQHCELLGYPAVARVLPIGGWNRNLHPDDRDALIAELAAARRENRTYAIECRILREDTGEERWMAAYGRVFEGADGELERGIGFAFDITDRKRIEIALRRSEMEFRSFFELSAAGSALADPVTHRFVRVNQRFCEITGRSEAELLCSTPFDVTHPEDRQKSAREIGPGSSGEPALETEKRYLRPDGSVVWVHVAGRVLHDSDGQPYRALASVVDITARKLAEAELRAADRRKDEFLATLAHELRNPLAPIRYAARLLRADAPNSTLATARETIERQAAHMARLLDDLLDVSRITRNVIELRRETLDLRRTIEEVVGAVRPLAEAAQHRLALSLPGEGVWVTGDATRLAQIVDNLMQNAVKYTDAGGRIGVELASEHGEAVIRVSDSGIGIPADRLDDVFALFAQVHDHDPGRRAGLGIGLAVVKRLVELHGGRLAAASDGAGCGSTFTVHLPLTEAPRAAASPVAAGTLYGARPRVLLVDDHEDIVTSLAALLRLEGYPVYTAADGPTALRLAAAVRPEVVVLDVGLPGMTGHEVARALRAEPWGGDLLLIAATGWGQAEDRRRSHEAGFDTHLTKPVDPDELLRLIAGVPRSAARANPAS